MPAILVRWRRLVARKVARASDASPPLREEYELYGAWLQMREVIVLGWLLHLAGCGC